MAEPVGATPSRFRATSALRSLSPTRRFLDGGRDRRIDGGTTEERPPRGDRVPPREPAAPPRPAPWGGGSGADGAGNGSEGLREEWPTSREKLAARRPARDFGSRERDGGGGGGGGGARRWEEEPGSSMRSDAGSAAREETGKREERRPYLSVYQQSTSQDGLTDANGPLREDSRSFRRRGTEGSLLEPALQERRRSARSLHEDTRWQRRAAAAAVPVLEKSRSQEGLLDSNDPLAKDTKRWEREVVAGGSVREKSLIWEQLIEAENPHPEKSRSQHRRTEARTSPREGSWTERRRLVPDIFLQQQPGTQGSGGPAASSSLREESGRWKRQAAAGVPIAEKPRKIERQAESEHLLSRESGRRERRGETDGPLREAFSSARRRGVESLPHDQPVTQGQRSPADHVVGETSSLERRGFSSSLREGSGRWNRQAAAGPPLVAKSANHERRADSEHLRSEESRRWQRRVEPDSPLREDSGSARRRGVATLPHDQPVTQGLRSPAEHVVGGTRSLERRGFSSSLHEESGRWNRRAAAAPLVAKSRNQERPPDAESPPPRDLSGSLRRTDGTGIFSPEEPSTRGKRGSATSLCEEPSRRERRAAAARLPVLEKSRSQEGLVDSDGPLRAAEPRRRESGVEADGRGAPEGRPRVSQPWIRRPSQAAGDQPGSPEKPPRWGDSEFLVSPRRGVPPAKMRLALFREKLAAEGMILQDSKVLGWKQTMSSGAGNQGPGTGVRAARDSPGGKEAETGTKIEAKPESRTRIETGIETGTKTATRSETKTRIETSTETGTETITRAEIKLETKPEAKTRTETRIETMTKTGTRNEARTGSKSEEPQVDVPSGVRTRSGFALEGDRDQGQRSPRGVGVHEAMTPITNRARGPPSPAADVSSPPPEDAKRSARRIIGDYLSQPRAANKPAGDGGASPKPRSPVGGGGGVPAAPAATTNEPVHDGGFRHDRRAAEAGVPTGPVSRPADEGHAANREEAAAARSARHRHQNGGTPSPGRGGTDNGGALAGDAESRAEDRGPPLRKVVGLRRRRRQTIDAEETERAEEGVGDGEELENRTGGSGHRDGPAFGNGGGFEFPSEGPRDEKGSKRAGEGPGLADGGERQEAGDYEMSGPAYEPDDEPGWKKESLKTESPAAKQPGLGDLETPEDSERGQSHRNEKPRNKTFFADDDGAAVPATRWPRRAGDPVAGSEPDREAGDASDPGGRAGDDSQRRDAVQVGTAGDLSHEESSRFKACLVHLHVNRDDGPRDRGRTHADDGPYKCELVINREGPGWRRPDLSRAHEPGAVAGDRRDQPGQPWGGRDRVVAGGDHSRGHLLLFDSSKRDDDGTGQEEEAEEEEGEEEEREEEVQEEDGAYKRDSAGDDNRLTDSAPGPRYGYRFPASVDDNHGWKEGVTDRDAAGHRNDWPHDVVKDSAADSDEDSDTFEASAFRDRNEKRGFADGDDLGSSHDDNNNNKAWTRDGDYEGLTHDTHSLDNGYKFQESEDESYRDQEAFTDRDDLGPRHKGDWAPALDKDSLADNTQNNLDGYKFKASINENHKEKEAFTDRDDLGPRHESDWASALRKDSLPDNTHGLDNGYTFKASTENDLRHREHFPETIDLGPRHKSHWAHDIRPRADSGEEPADDGGETPVSDGPRRDRAGREPGRDAEHAAIGDATRKELKLRSSGDEDDDVGIRGGREREDVAPATPPRRHSRDQDEDATPGGNVYNGGSGYAALGENSDEEEDGDAGDVAAAAFAEPGPADVDRAAPEDIDDVRLSIEGERPADFDSAIDRTGLREDEFAGPGEGREKDEPVADNPARFDGGGTAASDGTDAERSPRVRDSRAGHVGPAAEPDAKGTGARISPRQWVDYFPDDASESPDGAATDDPFADVPTDFQGRGRLAGPDASNPFLYVHDAIAPVADLAGRAGGWGSAGGGGAGGLFAKREANAGRFVEDRQDDLESLADWLRDMGPSPNPLPVPKRSRERPPLHKVLQLYRFLPPIREDLERCKPAPIVLPPPPAAAVAPAPARKAPDVVPPALDAASSPPQSRAATPLSRTPTYDKYRPHENFSAVVSNSKQSYLDMISKIKSRPSRFAKEGLYFQSKDGFSRSPMSPTRNYGYSFSRSLDSEESLDEKASPEKRVARDDSVAIDIGDV